MGFDIIILLSVLTQGAENSEKSSPAVPDVETWGEWVGGGSAGYIYNSYRSNFESCPMGHACVGSCFSKGCDPYEIQKGKFIRGTFCQYMGDNYSYVRGETSFFNTMSMCGDGDYVVGITQGNFTFYSSFQTICARGTPSLYADHSRAILTDWFCPQNHVAVGRCYETKTGSCPDGKLKCAPIIRIAYAQPPLQSLHKIAGTKKEHRLGDSDLCKQHPLAVSLDCPESLSVSESSAEGEVITVVNGTNKIVQLSLLSLNGTQKPFIFRKFQSNVLSKSNFTHVSASSSHIFLASTTDDITRIYRTNYKGEQLTHVLGGEIGIDLKKRILCNVSFLQHDEDETSLYIGQPNGFLKWDFTTSEIQTIGSPVCRLDFSKEIPIWNKPLCLFSKKNSTFIVSQSGQIGQESKGEVYILPSQPRYRSDLSSESFTSCAYSSAIDYLYFATKESVIAYSLQKDYPEEIYIAGKQDRSDQNFSGTIFKSISHLLTYKDKLLITDSGADYVYALENQLSVQYKPKFKKRSQEMFPPFVKAVMSRLYRPLAAEIVDIKQFLHGEILVVLKNDLQVFGLQKGTFSRSMELDFHYENKVFGRTFSDLRMACVRDYIVYFVDGKKRGLYGADIRTREVFQLIDGNTRRIHIEDMMVAESKEELYILSKVNKNVSLYSINLSTRELQVLKSDLHRYLPNNGKYSIAQYKASTFVSSGKRVIGLRKKTHGVKVFIFGEFSCNINRLAVDVQNQGLFMLCNKSMVLRASLQESELPRLAGLLVFPSEQDLELSGIAFHDVTGNILFSSSSVIHHLQSAEQVCEYVPENVIRPLKSFFSSSLGHSREVSSPFDHGSVQIEGNLDITVFQLLDDGRRFRPQIDVIIHGDFWKKDTILESQSMFLSSFLPETLFSEAIIVSSTLQFISSQKIRVTVGHDSNLKIPLEYTQFAFTNDIPEYFTESGKRPIFSDAPIIPQVRIHHCGKLWGVLKIMFLGFAGLSIINSNGMSYVFYAVSQASYTQPGIRCMTKASLCVWSPFYNTLADLASLPHPLSRLICTTGLILLIFSVLYALHKSIPRKADSSGSFFLQLLLKHGIGCAIILAYTTLSHVSYLGIFTNPTLIWIAYITFLHAALLFIFVGTIWLRKAKLQWRANHLLPDLFTPSGLWLSSKALSWKYFFYNDFDEKYRYGQIIILIYFQILLACASVLGKRWVDYCSYCVNILTSFGLSMFYLVLRPTRWKILSLTRSVTLNGFCLFLLMEMAGSSELVTGIVAVLVMFFLALEGFWELVIVRKESELWKTIASDVKV